MKTLWLVILWMALLALRGEAQQSAAQFRAKRLTRDEAETIQKSSKIALLVGVGDYDRAVSGLAPLKYPIADVDGVARILTQEGYSVRMLTDRTATAGAIRQNIKDLTKAIDRGEGTFLFMFSGHGGRLGEENYLATFGTSVANLAQGLSLDELKNLLQATGARQRIAFIDACRDDAVKGAATLPPMRDTKDSEGLRILYSTAPGDVSYEDDSLQHGIFSSFLIDGLSGRAANPQDGLITFTDLTDFVTRGMRTYGVTRPGGKIQIPYQLGESTGDFLVAKLDPMPVVARPSTPAPTQRPSSDQSKEEPSPNDAPSANVQQRIYVVDTNIATNSAGQPCSLTPGDIVRSLTTPSGTLIAVTVVAVKPGDCVQNSTVAISASALADMQRRFAEQIRQAERNVAK